MWYPSADGNVPDGTLPDVLRARQGFGISRFPIAISVIFPLWWQTLPHFPVKIPLKWENCSEKVRLGANS